MACRLVGAKPFIWTNVGISLIGFLGTNSNGMLIEIQWFSFKRMRLNVSYWKFGLGLNELLNWGTSTVVRYSSLHLWHACGIKNYLSTTRAYPIDIFNIILVDHRHAKTNALPGTLLSLFIRNIPGNAREGFVAFQYFHCLNKNEYRGTNIKY